MEQAVKTGEYLRARLSEMEEKHPKFVQKLRGRGMYLSFDSESFETRNTLLHKLKSHGINQGFCGEKSSRLRPTLYFENNHVDFYVNALDRACTELS